MPVPSCVRPARPRRGGSARRCAAAPSPGMPVPVSRTVELDAIRRAARRRTSISPSNVNLNAFESEVQDDLLPHVAVDVDRLRRAAGSRRQPQARPARPPSGSCSRAPRSARRGRSARRTPATRPASMREKSSSVLTSFSRRSPLRCATPSCSRSRGASGACRGAQHVLERPSISVSGVRNSWLTLREERGLGAVELGQRLGALALLLVGARVGDRRRDLRPHQLEEAAVVLVEPQPRADAGDQEARGLVRLLDGIGSDHGRVRRIGPRSPRHARRSARRGARRPDRLGPPSPQRAASASSCASRRSTSAGLIGRRPSRRRRPRRGRAVRAVGVDQVEERERHVLAVRGERLRRRARRPPPPSSPRRRGRRGRAAPRRAARRRPSR